MAEDENVVIKLISDKPSEVQTLASIARVKNDIRAAFSSDAATKFRSDVKNINKEFDDLRKSIGKAADEKKRLDSTNGGSSGGADKASRITGAAGRALGAVSPGAGSALRDIQDIQEFGKSLSDISKVAVGAGVGIGAATLALSLLQAQAQKAKDAAAAELSARSEVIGFIQTATQAEIKSKIDELKQKQAINAAIANDANSVRDQLESQTNAIGKFNAAIGTGAGELTAAREAADKANKALNDNSTALTLLQQAADAGFASERDYAEAIKKTNDERAKADILGAADEYNRQLKLQQDQLLNSSQLFSKVTSAIQEQNAAQSALNQLQKGYLGGNADKDKQILAYQLQIGRAGADITRYYDLIAQRKPIEDAIQNQKDLAAAQASAQKDIEKVNADSQADLAKKNEDIAALNNKLADSLDNLKSSYAQANLDAANENLQKQADLIAKNNQDKEDAETSLNDDLLKIKDDYGKRVKEIEREYSRTSADAIQDRDAVALDAAERKRSDDLNGAKTQKSDDERLRRAQYDQQLRDLRTNLIRQQTELQAAFIRDGQQRAQKYQQDQQALIQANQRDTAARNAEYNKQLTELSKYLTARSQTEQGYFGAILAYAKSVKDSITNMLGGGVSSVVNGIVSGGGTAPIISFAGGGTLTKDGWVKGHKGEVILNRRQQAGVGAGFTFAPQINGSNRAQVTKEVMRQFNEFYDGYEKG